MSIKPISFADRKRHYQNGLLITTGAGAVAGGTLSSFKKNWLYKDAPSDTFIKNVSKNLEKTMTPEQIKESHKIKTFLNYAVDAESDLTKLKQQILDSQELSEAIKNTPEETVEEAIARVYSNPDASQVRKDLIDLQLKTKSDKIASENTAKRIVHENFNSETKTLVKSEGTSEKVFNMIKKAAKSAQRKSVAIKTGLGAILAGALYLVLTDVPEKKVK